MDKEWSTPTTREPVHSGDTVTRAWAKGFAAGTKLPRKCPQIESKEFLCDRPAEYEINGVVICEFHARFMQSPDLSSYVCPECKGHNLSPSRMRYCRDCEAAHFVD